MQLPQFDDEQKWPPAMTTLLLALEAALNSVMHSLPHAPFPAIACLLEDPLLLQAYQRPPQLNFQPQLSPRVQSYFRHPRARRPRRPVAAAAAAAALTHPAPPMDGRQHRVATVLNDALNAVLTARPDPARALAVLAEELRRSSAVAPKPAPPAAKPTSVSSVENLFAMQRLQQGVQSAMGTHTAVREQPPPPLPPPSPSPIPLSPHIPAPPPSLLPPPPRLLPGCREAARAPCRRWRLATAAPRCCSSWSANRALRRAASCGSWSRSV
jgi:hypothetical protein